MEHQERWSEKCLKNVNKFSQLLSSSITIKNPDRQSKNKIARTTKSNGICRISLRKLHILKFSKQLFTKISLAMFLKYNITQ